jgi:hypothetical protein
MEDSKINYLVFQINQSKLYFPFLVSFLHSDLIRTIVSNCSFEIENVRIKDIEIGESCRGTENNNGTEKTPIDSSSCIDQQSKIIETQEENNNDEKQISSFTIKFPQNLIEIDKNIVGKIVHWFSSQDIPKEIEEKFFNGESVCDFFSNKVDVTDFIPNEFETEWMKDWNVDICSEILSFSDFFDIDRLSVLCCYFLVNIVNENGLELEKMKSLFKK